MRIFFPVRFLYPNDHPSLDLFALQRQLREFAKERRDKNVKKEVAVIRSPYALSWVKIVA